MADLSSYTVTIGVLEDLNGKNYIPNAPIEIRERLANGSSGSLSSIFSDQAGTTPITQTGATANGLGQFTFFAVASQYNAVYDNDGTPVEIAVDVGVTGGILNQTIDKLNPNTLNDAIIDLTIQDGDTLNVKERTTGNRGGAIWDVVLSSSVTTNTFNIVQCTGVGALALVLRIDNSIYVRTIGAVGDDSTIDNAALQAAIDLAKNKELVFSDGDYVINAKLDFTDWSGKVTGTGKIRCVSVTDIPIVLDFTTAVAVTWDGVEVNMGQDNSVESGDDRTDRCFYFLNSRSCRVTNVTVTNVRVGEPIYINGNSSLTPSASDGSKRIFVDNFQCVAHVHPTVDIGAAVFIRSDFYLPDDGGTYYASTNGLRVDDLTLDPAVSFPQTTSDIFFNNCTFTNFDRIGYFNVKSVHMTNVTLNNFDTRGHSLSPSCSDITVTGGAISGNAAQINANYGCENCTFSNLAAQGESTSTGQRHSLRTGFGCNNITFSNISGIGSDQYQCFVEGSSNVTYDNINLADWQGGSTVSALCVTTPSGATGYTLDNVNFTNCNFKANYAVEVVQGDGTIKQRAVKITDCTFINTLNVLRTVNTAGEIVWTNSTCSEIRNDSMDPRAFSKYSGGNIGLQMRDQYVCLGTSADQFPTFADLYYPTTFSNQGDSKRDIPLNVYLKVVGADFFVPLVYTTDWFIDSGTFNMGMANQIRLVNFGVGGLFNAGDIIQIERKV